MHFLEKFLPSLRRSPEIAQMKKDLAAEKEANIEARDRVLRSVKTLMDDFDILRAAKRKDVITHLKNGRGK